MKETKLPNNAAYSFAKLHGLGETAAAIRNTEIRDWDRPYKTSVRRGFIIELFQSKGLLETFITQAWPEGKTPEGQENIAFCLKLKEDYNRFIEKNEEESEEQIEGEKSESLTFALENHLRDFLAKNLDKVEKGLSLYRNEENTGIEFSVDGGRIDILAVDKENKPVVIELKLSAGRNKVLGQILYYMSWVDQNLGLGKSRGIIIANSIYPELQLAVSRAPGVELAIYKMQFSIERIVQ